MIDWLKRWNNPRKYFYRDCDCGAYDKCKIKHYTTDYGMGIESGLDDCPKVIRQIEQLSKLDLT